MEIRPQQQIEHIQLWETSEGIHIASGNGFKRHSANQELGKLNAPYTTAALKPTWNHEHWINQGTKNPPHGHST